MEDAGFSVAITPRLIPRRLHAHFIQVDALSSDHAGDRDLVARVSLHSVLISNRVDLVAYGQHGAIVAFQTGVTARNVGLGGLHVLPRANGIGDGSLRRLSQGGDRVVLAS